MSQKKQPKSLAWGEYILPESNQNIEIARARLELIRVAERVLPRFVEQLREQVYPSFPKLVQKSPRAWKSERSLEVGKLLSDVQHQLPCLVAWVEKFNAADEMWILEGAVQTLSLWHREPELRDSLDIRGFQSFCAVDTLISVEEALFRFNHPGWDPQFQKWKIFRIFIEKEFKGQLQIYEQRLRGLLESRGAVRARFRYSSDNLAWFVLYQLGGMSAIRILKRRTDLKGDESTILKGVRTAADLLQWKTIRKARKPALSKS